MGERDATGGWGLPDRGRSDRWGNGAGRVCLEMGNRNPVRMFEKSWIPA